MRRAAVIAAAAALALPAGAAGQDEPAEDRLLPPSGTCAHADNPDAHHRLQRLAMHCLLRAVRRRAERPTLGSSAFLRHSATFKARRIAQCKIFSHYPCGDKLAAPFRKAEVTQQGRWLVGENLAYGVAENASARVILRGWLDSETHRDVLTDRRFRYVGVRRRRLRMKGAPVGSIIWVAHFGVPRDR